MTPIRRKAIAHLIAQLLTLALAGVFLTHGVGNLFYSDTWGKAFFDPSYPTWFRHLVGFVELSAGMLLLAPWTVDCGVLIVITLIVMEMTAHLLEGKANQVGSEVAPLFLVLLILVARNERLLRWLLNSPQHRNA